MAGRVGGVGAAVAQLAHPLASISVPHTADALVRFWRENAAGVAVEMSRGGEGGRELGYHLLKEICERAGEAKTRDGVGVEGIEGVIVETLVTLMVEFEPASVCGFLMVNDGYRLDRCLEVCRGEPLANTASAYLLER